VSAGHKDPAKVACVYPLEKRFSNNAANVQLFIDRTNLKTHRNTFTCT
jgi:hypothetical protein